MTGDIRPAQLLAQEREGQPTEVRAAAGAADDEVGSLADLGELQQSLLADDRLVQQHVVEHRAERVVGRRRAARRPRPPRRSRCPATRVSRGARPGCPAGAVSSDGDGCTGAAEGLHHEPAIGLGVIGGPHLPDLALQPELRAGEGQRGAPLPGAGLGRELLDARPWRCRTPAAPRCSACASRRGRRLRTCSRSAPACPAPSQPVRAVQRRGPPQPVDVEGSGGCRRTLGRDLLLDEVHREQREQVVRPDRLPGARVQRRRRRGQVVQDVVPAGRHLVLVEDDLGWATSLRVQVTAPNPGPARGQGRGGAAY
jgi:hypothetical protein